MGLEEEISANQNPGLVPSQLDRQSIFYANSIGWVVNQQEAVFDFKLILPEHFQMVAMTTTDGKTQDNSQVDLARIPVEVRIIIPRLQFDVFVEKIAETGQKLADESMNDISAGK